MNKDLDHLFEQARKSMQSEMPLEEVQGLIHGQASPSLWTKKITWIMSTSIISILTIGIACWFNHYNQPTTNTATTAENSKEPAVTLQQNLPQQQLVTIKEARPDNIPLPTLNSETTVPNSIVLASSVKDNSKASLGTKKTTKLDSLGPKKTFTEYKLEIKKENSEQEIKKLKSELANYGVHMNVQVLDYDNNNKIKRFKGKFKTDSLFCGSTMNNYEFDISGAFKSMEFIFRVADDKNLKYLKIQSENFEETIECYDDEVISSTQEARKLNQIMQEEMAEVQREMAEAQEEMANAQQEIARVQEEMFRLKKEEHSKNNEIRLKKSGIINWAKIESDIDKAMENVELELEGVNQDLMETLEDMEVIILDKNFKKDMKALKKDLAKMRLEIEGEVSNIIEEHQLKQKEIKQEERFNLRTAKELEKEAAKMEEAAKKLKKEAKEKRKIAKKKAKSK